LELVWPQAQNVAKMSPRSCIWSLFSIRSLLEDLPRYPSPPRRVRYEIEVLGQARIIEKLIFSFPSPPPSTTPLKLDPDNLSESNFEPPPDWPQEAHLKFFRPQAQNVAKMEPRRLI
jgi:hypothetical protein